MSGEKLSKKHQHQQQQQQQQQHQHQHQQQQHHPDQQPLHINSKPTAHDPLTHLNQYKKKKKKKPKKTTDNTPTPSKHSAIDTLSKYTEADPYIQFKPHTITLLLLAGLALVYVAFTRQDDTDTVTNIKMGVVGASCVFLLFSLLQMKDGLFVRPHPAFWRVVMGVSVLYLVILVFMFFQNVGDARQLLKHIDPSLGERLPERSYAEDCRIYTPDDPVSSFRNVKDALADEFVLAHLIGWWMKMLIIRDLYLCWTLSILFEIVELTFANILPNFNECWWDQVILDVLGANCLGIFLGLLTCQYFKMKRYNWAGAPTSWDWKSILSLFTPAKFESYDWEILSKPSRFVYILALLGLFELVELNAFFLKYILWIPPPHKINLLRLLIWFGIAMPAFREIYQFLTDKNCQKYGTMVWLAFAIAGMEALIWIKFGWNELTISFPWYMVWFWCIFSIVFTTWAVVFFWNKKKETER